jgi:lipopolysaccharide/colanic/teichoic acid biosynthesis glycosyltransferase
MVGREGVLAVPESQEQYGPERKISVSDAAPVNQPELLEERIFRRLITIERKRTERSHDPFLLMLFDMDAVATDHRQDRLQERLAAVLLQAARETDLVGWYRTGAVFGVLFTGLAPDNGSTPRGVIFDRVQSVLRESLTEDELEQVSISVHQFPEDWKLPEDDSPVNPVFYGDLLSREKHRRTAVQIKRVLDVAGSLFALLLFSPLLLAIALAVKLSSCGPVLFRQQRVGQYGRNFTFLKFRSMVVNNDASEHKAYVEKLIAGKAERHGEGEGVFKLANDKRITRLGHFLRRTSLDELPQFFNVLRGEMSLVGPRPPLPYEIDAYQAWHRRRILEAKPGITGLWQVKGRSRVTFDEMVRLDLQYAASWTPWMDIKILVCTPLAVIRGAGAH